MSQVTTPSRPPTDQNAAPSSPAHADGGSAVYDSFYYAHYCGERAYRRDPTWLQFFGGIAEQIVARIGPATVLDAGCAMGMVVESLRDRGVEAFGVDISEYAIDHVRDDVRPFCRVGSILEPFPRRYDLIVCIEVLEHLPVRDAERAVANFVEFTDDVLFSSTPKDFKETTHFNVQPPEWWAELFARHGFYRDVGFDASFITPWAVRFRRLRGPVARVVGDYERRLWWLEQDNAAQRELGMEQRNRLAAQEAAASGLGGRVEELQRTLDEANREREALRAQVAQERELRWAAEYRWQVGQVKSAVAAHVPAGARVLVISGGDESLVGFEGREGWHFPRTPEGWHAGTHPADGAEAVRHLESLRHAGAEWLVVPAHARWWLEQYGDFGEHLHRSYRVAHGGDACVIFDLRRAAAGHTGGASC
jgi:hypothetical protein